jgi:hypothetical protein
MSLLTFALYLIVALIIAGFILWALDAAPFIAPTVKPWIRWVVIVVIGVFCIALLLQLLGMSFGNIRVR